MRPMCHICDLDAPYTGYAGLHMSLRDPCVIYVTQTLSTLEQTGWTGVHEYTGADMCTQEYMSTLEYTWVRYVTQALSTRVGHEYTGVFMGQICDLDSLHGLHWSA